MTISEIKQLSAVDGWVDCAGQITKVGEIKQRTKSQMSKSPGQQYNVQKLEIADQSDTIGIWAYANQQFLPSQYVSVHGMLKEFNNIRYIDFANVKQEQATTSIPQSAPPTHQQGPQQAAQPPKDNYQDQKAKERTSIERQAAGRSASLAWANAKPSDIIELAIAIQYFHESGSNLYDIPEPDPSIQENPQEPDIPF